MKLTFMNLLGLCIVLSGCAVKESNSNRAASVSLGEILQAATGDEIRARRMVSLTRSEYERYGSVRKLAVVSRALQGRPNLFAGGEPKVMVPDELGEIWNETVSRAWKVKRILLWNEKRAYGPCLEIVLDRRPISILIYRDPNVSIPDADPSSDLRCEELWIPGVYVVYMARIGYHR